MAQPMVINVTTSNTNNNTQVTGDAVSLPGQTEVEKESPAKPKFCPECGAKIECNSNKFCPKCGGKLG